MFKFAVVGLAMVAVSCAYEHHGFVSEVKHIPYKWYGGMQGGMGMGGGSMGGGMGMGGGMSGGGMVSLVSC